MYVVKTPWWLRLLYGSQLTWNIPTKEKEIYLTFDDGPHPTITPFVLDQLKDSIPYVHQKTLFFNLEAMAANFFSSAADCSWPAPRTAPRRDGAA